MVFCAVSQYILGIQPVAEGLKIDPFIPSSWEGFEVTRRFRGKNLNICVKNPNAVEKGVIGITINGIIINGNIVRFNLMVKHNEIEVIMG